MNNRDLGGAIKTGLLFAVLVGIVLGVALTKGCEYLQEHTNIEIKWRTSP